MTIEIVADKPDRKPNIKAQVARMAAVEFTAVKEFRGFTKVDRLRRTHELVDNVRALSVLAAEIIAMEKAELVEKVSDKHEEWGPFLMQLAEAKDDAKALINILGSAESRMAVALAVAGESHMT